MTGAGAGAAMHMHMHMQQPGGGGRKKEKGREREREVEVSKTLSYLLRHGARSEGIRLDEAGWAGVGDVLNWRRFASKKVHLNELHSIVATNDKKRYQIEPDPAATHATDLSDPSHWRIRATQGHSITTVVSERIFKPILLNDADCPDSVVHGTDLKSWGEIERSGGLKPMRRKHIHFATRLPPKMPDLNLDFQSKSKPQVAKEDAVVSGMRSTSTVVIWVDVKKSLKGGVKWWRSENEVILTEGVGEPKMLGLEWVKWVERRGDPGEILFGEKVESEGVRELEEGMDRLGVGLRDREEASRDKVSGGRATLETGSGEEILPEMEDSGNKKLEQATVVKDNWND